MRARWGLADTGALLLAVLVSVASIATRELEYFAVGYERFYLSAFDGHVYVAMAEKPVPPSVPDSRRSATSLPRRCQRAFLHLDM